MPLRLSVLFLLAALVSTQAVNAADNPSAEIAFRIAPNETARYAWSTNAANECSGTDAGKPFTRSTDSTVTLSLLLTGLPRKGESMPVAIKVQDYDFKEKQALAGSTAEMSFARGHVKCVENDKVVIDSDNDIGIDAVASYQQHLKAIESGEMSLLLDAHGRESEIQGDPVVIETVGSVGAEGLFRMIPGRALAPGESWEDKVSIAHIGDFKLAHSAAMRSKMTFTGWEQKEGKPLARIELVSSWDSVDLKGENENGLTVDITRVEGAGTGACLFDPAAGRFVSGAISATAKYRIEGKRGTESTALDVRSTTKFTFSLQEGK